MEVAVLESEALKLPEYERAILVDHLQQSLSANSITNLADHLRESHESFEAYQSGEIQALDGDSAVFSIRSNLLK